MCSKINRKTCLLGDRSVSQKKRSRVNDTKQIKKLYYGTFSFAVSHYYMNALDYTFRHFKRSHGACVTILILSPSQEKKHDIGAFKVT